MKRKFLLILLISLIGSLANATEWNLVLERSTISYLSTKLPVEDGSLIFEPNLFRKFSGVIDGSEVNLTIELNSLDTKIPIRDERIAEHVFLSKQFPQALITASVVDLDKMDKSIAKRVAAQLTLRGKTHSVNADLIIDRMDESTLAVQTSTPILIDTKAYGMLEGFGKLEEIAGLFYIPTTIPVSLHLVFAKQ